MKTIQRMYDYLSWANEYVLDTIHYNKDNPELLRLFSHILFAEKVWLTRMKGKDSTKLVIWGELDYEQCRQLLQENKEEYINFLASLTEEKLQEKIEYVATSTGTAFTNTVEEALHHVALHGQYHRGQINLKLRELGYEPVNVDFITFIRK
ncbi:MAG: DinB family protein [Kurthia sp.]|nr:DinB family protein [Candidatus Kurthia equi]